MITDMHVHIMPAYDPAAMLRAAAVAGIGRMIVSDVGDSSEFPPPEEVRIANDRAAAFAAERPGRVWFLAYLNPQNDDAEAELERALARGVIGIKLWISLRDPKHGLERTKRLLRRAGALRLPVLVHTFSRTDELRPGEVDARMLFELARECPETTLIGAHAGGNVRVSAPFIAASPDNLYWDLSGGFPRRGILGELLEHTAPEKLLWGSDMPGRSFESQLAKVRYEALPEAVKKLILNGNAERIFGLPPSDEAVRLPEYPSSDRLPDMTEDHFVFAGAFPPGGVGVTPAELQKILAGRGVVRGYAANLNDLYRDDLPRANRQWLRAAAAANRIVPLATLDPSRMDALFQLCLAAEAGFTGIWVSPYCHNYRLDDERHADFWRAAADRRLPVWINTMLDDHRFRQRGQALRPVTDAELIRFRETAPDNRYVIQGAYLVPPVIRKTPLAEVFAGDDRFAFDDSKIGDLGSGLVNLLKYDDPRHLVHGSEFPLRDPDQTRTSLNSLAATPEF